MKYFTVASLTLILVLHCSCTRMTKEEVFWEWFRANEARLFDFESDRDVVFSELSRELKKVHSDLVFEFGPKNERRDFVVSADGIKAAFPAVMNLVDKTRRLERWNIIKFRQRGKPEVNMVLNGEKLSSDQFQFTIEPDGDKVGIHRFTSTATIKTATISSHKAGFLFFDNCLGEYDMEMKVGFIEFEPASEQSVLVKQPLSKLPETFDKFTS